MDHTLGTSKGFYIYLETSLPTKKGDRARLVSEPFVSETAGCLDFWYHMRGNVSFLL